MIGVVENVSFSPAFGPSSILRPRMLSWRLLSLGGSIFRNAEVVKFCGTAIKRYSIYAFKFSRVCPTYFDLLRVFDPVWMMLSGFWVLVSGFGRTFFYFDLP